MPSGRINGERHVKVVAGAICYSHGTPPCIGKGVALDAVELDKAISGPVSDVVFDVKGKAEVATLLAGVVETDFSQQRLAEILAHPVQVEGWRVGEAIAEVYLTHHRKCQFPWPDGRDERKSGSSLPGADLVGFGADSVGPRFAFGEVKTSSQEMWPPGAMHGRMGLKQQLEDLRDQKHIRDDLVRYLAHRIAGQAWANDFKNAYKRYVKETPDLVLYGLMIRDVEPKLDDLRIRVEKLSEGCPLGTEIELLAIYLPKGSVSLLGTKTITVKQKGKT
jgi:hypothetical protein